MILGQSIFDAVMGRLKEEYEEAQPPLSASEDRWNGIKGLNSGFVGASHDFTDSASPRQLGEAYFAFLDDTPKSADEPDKGALKFNRLSPEEIAEDMALSNDDTPAILQAKRRGFARHNHPDLAPEEWREQASLRMKIANLLIDEALRQAARQIT
jgi:hypothetical protein